MTTAVRQEHAEHLRALAEGFRTTGSEMAEPLRSAAFLSADELEEIADELDRPEPEPTRPCGKPPRRGRLGPCDRPAGHEGDCSWEAARMRRLARDFEAEATRVPRLEGEVRALGLKLTEAESELRTLRLWREAWRNREQLGRQRRRRQEAERG